MPVIIAGFIVAFGTPDRLLDFACDDTHTATIAGVADHEWPAAGYVFQQVPRERVASFHSTPHLRATLHAWVTAPQARDQTWRSDQSSPSESHTAHPSAE